MMPPLTAGALTTLDAIRPDNHPARDASFSKRERQIVALLATGCSNRDIADRLGLRLQTVKNHLSRMYRKRRVPNRVQLAVLAVRGQADPDAQSS